MLQRTGAFVRTRGLLRAFNQAGQHLLERVRPEASNDAAVKVAEAVA